MAKLPGRARHQCAGQRVQPLLLAAEQVVLWS
jgi:hypothetical protein